MPKTPSDEEILKMATERGLQALVEEGGPVSERAKVLLEQQASGEAPATEEAVEPAAEAQEPGEDSSMRMFR